MYSWLTVDNKTVKKFYKEKIMKVINMYERLEITAIKQGEYKD